MRKQTQVNKKKKIYIEGLKCPDCGAFKLRHAGHAIGSKYKVHRRYHCDNCQLHTIHPVKVKS